ncbi:MULTISPECIES: Mrp/NBP35 family ATP-binding protein [Clostridium]|uniref:Iron-sulfur cluster carrier protein n=1 Tax=Clostridium ragsdalei P11 TaxID=1353534 RepID=A0A1A6AJC1_9CLOT|nr:MULTISPECIES: Mrp/NBP35 family ATP-binding protein [Clostridium]OBR90113.1 antiporter inner membrane protein [Clostridium ragsdalei P11]QXE18808.1 sodium:proton antiporter [Clostridium sp. 001]
MSECNSCPSNGGCDKDKQKCMIENNPLNKVKKIIGVMSGKGGVGKSSISVLIAKRLKELGYSTGILDADITGPSVPRLVGLKDKKVISDGELMHPVDTDDGIKVMSLNLLVDNENDPVIWRGPMIGGVVKQFWTDVLWGELDYLVIDMPPGTSDVALTVMQSIPINGIVMVSVPQDLVSMIVSKAVNMARAINIDVLGVIENMSYITCPDCGKKIKPFNGESTTKFLEEMNLKLLGEIPVLNSVGNLSDPTYKNEDEDLEKVFYPIVDNVMKSLDK